MKDKPYNPIASARFYAQQAAEFLERTKQFIDEAKAQDQLTSAEKTAAKDTWRRAMKEAKELAQML